MQNLIPFPHNPASPETEASARSTDAPVVEADLQFEGSDLCLEFRFLNSQTDLLGLPEKAACWDGTEVPRQDDLWQATCFEAFLNPIGSSKYFEFNFSLKPAWNAYRFENYRTPQPATPTLDFVLKSMKWDPSKKHLLLVLENKTSYSQFRVGLSAIFLEKNGTKHYFALAHKGTQPDFHLVKSFILQRGTEE